MSSLFSRWVPVTLPFFDTEIKLKLRAFSKKEAPEFKRGMRERFESLAQLEGETVQAHVARIDTLLDKWKDLCRDTFARYVRVAEPIQDADDPSVNITDGATLYEQAGGDFALLVMTKLGELASLGDMEGNAFGSPSTSAVEASPNTSDAPASTIAESDSTSPSIATDESSLAVSSTPAV